MHRLEQADPHHLRDPARIVAVRLVDLLRRQQSLHVPRLHADYRQLGRRQSIDQPLRQRAGLDPDPAEGRAERGQKGDDILRLGPYFLFQDHLAGIVDNAHRRFLHRHIKTNEMRHLIAPSSMLEVAPTSIHSSSQKGMRTHHPSVSRSRRDTPSLNSPPEAARTSAISSADKPCRTSRGLPTREPRAETTIEPGTLPGATWRFIDVMAKFGSDVNWMALPCPVVTTPTVHRLRKSMSSREGRSRRNSAMASPGSRD